MIQSEGLANTYRQNGEIRAQLKALAALAFVSQDQVVGAFETLAAAADHDLHDLYSRYERTFIGIIHRTFLISNFKTSKSYRQSNWWNSSTSEVSY